MSRRFYTLPRGKAKLSHGDSAAADAVSQHLRILVGRWGTEFPPASTGDDYPPATLPRCFDRYHRRLAGGQGFGPEGPHS